MGRESNCTNLAELLAAARGQPTAIPLTDDELEAAVDAVSRHLERPAFELPIPSAEPDHWLAEICGGNHGFEHREARAVRRAIDRALLVAGVRRMPSRHDMAPNPEWRALLDPLAAGKGKDLMMSFGRWCTFHSVEPRAVRMVELETCGRDMLETCTPAKARENFLVLCKSWEHARGNIPSWPALKAKPQLKRHWFTEPLTAYPLSLQAEIAAFSKARRAGDRTDLGGRAISAETAVSDELKWRLYLHWLVEAGVDKAALISIDAALSVNFVGRALDELFRKKSGKPSGALYNLASFITVVTKNWLAVHGSRSEADITLVEELRTNLNPLSGHLAEAQALGMSSRNREALRQMVSAQARDRLLGVAPTILARLSRKLRLTPREALTVETALALEISINAGLMPRQLCALKLSDFDEDAGGICLTTPQTSHSTFAWTLSRTAEGLLHLHRTGLKVRKKPADGALFPGAKGVAKNANILARQIARLIQSEAALKLTPAQVLNAIATLHIEVNDGALQQAAGYLGIKSPEAVKRKFAHLSADTGLKKRCSVLKNMTRHSGGRQEVA